MNVNKTKTFITASNKWVHKRCTGIKGSLARVDNFECKFVEEV